MRKQFLYVALGLIAAALFVPPIPALADDAELCASSEPDQAILACTRLISSSEVSETDRGIAYSNRAIFYANKGDYDRAIADSSKAIELDGKNRDAYINRGFSYANKGDHDRAIADATKAIELDGNYALGYNGRAWSLHKLGKFAEAKADADRAVSLAPKDMDFADTRGSILLALGDVDATIAEFTRAIELGSGYATTYTGRGQAYEKKGLKELALADYRKALEQPAPNLDQREAQSTARARIEALERSGPSSSPSRTTDTQSSKLSTEAEQIDFLRQYVILKSNVSETEFHIVYHDNSSGRVPGPSDWNIRVVMRVDDVAAWAEGKTQIDSADFSWAEPLLFDRLRPSSQPTFYVNGSTTIVIFEPEQIVFFRSTTFP